MKFQLFLVLVLLCTVQCKPKTKTPIIQISNGTVESLQKFESKYVTARDVDIWLPDSYNNKTEHAVLYMHDGQMLYDANTTWNKQEWKVDETVSELISAGQIRPTIVVGIHNAGKERHSDYFPQKPFQKLEQAYQDSLLTKAKRYGDEALFANKVSSDNYLKFVVEELKPYIDSNYSTAPDLEETYIAGSSMGGLISWYALCEYPEVFGGAACLSTHWIGTMNDENNPIPQKFFDYLEEKLPSPEKHKLYFDYGDQTLDAYYPPYQVVVDSIVRSKGYNEQLWKTEFFKGQDHSERSWSSRLHLPLEFLLAPEN